MRPDSRSLEVTSTTPTCSSSSWMVQPGFLSAITQLPLFLCVPGPAPSCTVPVRISCLMGRPSRHLPLMLQKGYGWNMRPREGISHQSTKEPFPPGLPVKRAAPAQGLPSLRLQILHLNLHPKSQEMPTALFTLSINLTASQIQRNSLQRKTPHPCDPAET